MNKLSFILFGLTLSAVLTAQTLSALEIIQKADSKTRGESFYSEMTMTIVRPTWERSISMKVWTKGIHLALIKITAPAKDQKTVLSITKSQYNTHIQDSFFSQQI